jgi:hypothetical protein
MERSGLTPKDVLGRLVVNKIRKYIENSESVYGSFDELLDVEMRSTIPPHLSDDVRGYLEPMLDELKAEYDSMESLRTEPEARIVSDFSALGHVRWLSKGVRKREERPSGSGWIRMG